MSSRVFQCKYCPYNTSRKEHLETHKEFHGPFVICEECGEELRDMPGVLGPHRKKVHSIYKCCDKEYNLSDPVQRRAYFDHDHGTTTHPEELHFQRLERKFEEQDKFFETMKKYEFTNVREFYEWLSEMHELFEYAEDGCSELEMLFENYKTTA